jgi:hypothetical protein
MSRHVFESEGIRLVVGWDPTLQTFFVQYGPVLSNGEWLGGEPRIWIGTAWQELHSIGQLLYLDDDYQMGLTKDVIALLEQDQRTNA